MNRGGFFGLAVVLAGYCIAAPAALAAPGGDFALGTNAEHQTCRAVARFDAPKGAKSADIYCGPWESPSGRISVFSSQAQAEVAVGQLCQGEATLLHTADFSELRQIACARTERGGVRRFALVASRQNAIAVGEVYPSDWAPLIDAARVLTGAAQAQAASAAQSSQTPCLSEIEAVFPAGPPGQGAAANYELLRRRAYEYNMIWSFGASQRDFEELLRVQRMVAPDDAAGEAEILAEIGLNMSSARRFDEASEVLDQAEARARTAGDALLATKVTNYRAIDQLNQRHFAAALRLALAANQARANLAGSDSAAGVKINASDVRQVEGRPAEFSHKSLLVSLSDENPADRGAILSAQGLYIAGVAARGLGQADAESYLASASRWLEQAESPPDWLVGDIANEQADLLLRARDFAGAERAAKSGLAIIQTVAPGTRSEAHLWLSLEAAQDGLGHTDDALASGRAAISIFSRQSESPGLPPDVAAMHLGLLVREWRRGGDQRLAVEYFQDLALVWDGAAARTTAQLAARLVLRQAGDQARAYQDAERAYRAAYARRQGLAADPDTSQDQFAEADAAIRSAATGLTAVRSALVDAPYVQEFPLVVECRLAHTFELGLHTQFVGEVVDVKADDGVLTERSVDIERVKPLTFTPNTHRYYGIGRFVGTAFSIGEQV